MSVLKLIQALEQELAQWEQKGTALAAQGADLVSAGHFDGPAIEKDSQAVLQAVRDLQPAAAARRHALESNLQSVILLSTFLLTF